MIISGWLGGRAFAPWTEVVGSIPDRLIKKDVIKMVPDHPAASLFSAQHIRIGMASLSSQTCLKVRDAFHMEWAVKSNLYIKLW